MTHVGQLGAYCSLYCALRAARKRERNHAHALDFLQRIAAAKPRKKRRSTK